MNSFFYSILRLKLRAVRLSRRIFSRSHLEKPTCLSCLHFPVCDGRIEKERELLQSGRENFCATTAENCDDWLISAGVELAREATRQVREEYESKLREIHSSAETGKVVVLSRNGTESVVVLGSFNCLKEAQAAIDAKGQNGHRPLVLGKVAKE